MATGGSMGSLTARRAAAEAMAVSVVRSMGMGRWWAVRRLSGGFTPS
ncbi:hypothetical protein [Synechococcus sp. ROS8604]|nr:hypothetical protein [Synechococcus sp. ROS8604]